MAIEIKAPTFPESVADGTVATWHKKPGEAVKRDELIVDIETDKVVMEVLAEADGVLAEIVKNEGDTVLSEEVLGVIGEGGAQAATSAPSQAAVPQQVQAATSVGTAVAERPQVATDDLSPAVRKLVVEGSIDPGQVQGTGKDGRLTKDDVLAAAPRQSSSELSSATVLLPGGHF